MGESEWKVIWSEEVFKGKLLKVRRETVRSPGGRTVVREIVVHPGSVAIVPLLDDMQVVMVRQYRHAVQGSLLEIPAGTLEPEETPKACALRELAEETGYTAGELLPLGQFFLAPGYSSERMHLFLARRLRPIRAQNADEEGLATTVIPFQEAVRRAIMGEIQDSKTVAALLMVWHKFQGTRG